MPNGRDNSVGYGRPPVYSRFKPGQSGNPNGRPKRPRSIRDELRDELLAEVSVGENAKTTRQRLIVKALVEKASKGDMRAIAVIVSLSPSVPDGESEASAIDDAKILADYERVARNGDGETGDENISNCTQRGENADVR